MNDEARVMTAHLSGYPYDASGTSSARLQPLSPDSTELIATLALGGCGAGTDEAQALELAVEARWTRRQSGTAPELEGRATIVDLRDHELVVLLPSPRNEAEEP